MQQGLLETLRWVRTVGDLIFIVGSGAVAWQVVKGVIAKPIPHAGATPELDPSLDL